MDSFQTFWHFYPNELLIMNHNSKMHMNWLLLNFEEVKLILIHLNNNDLFRSKTLFSTQNIVTFWIIKSFFMIIKTRFRFSSLFISCLIPSFQFEELIIYWILRIEFLYYSKRWKIFLMNILLLTFIF